MPFAGQSEGVIDPVGLGMAVGQLGGGSRRQGRAAFAVLGALLGDDERVEALVQGRFRGHAGAAVLTNRRLLMVNDREWRPDVAEVLIDATTTIQGWQDDRTAALVVQSGADAATIDQINEREMAQRFAASVRARATG